MFMVEKSRIITQIHVAAQLIPDMEKYTFMADI